MNITGRQTEELLNALLDVFDRSSLEQMLLFKLDVRLDSIVDPHGNMRKIVFELIAWARNHDKLLQLVEAAVQTRPANPRLSAFYDEFVGKGLTTKSTDAVVGHGAHEPHFEHDEVLKIHGLLVQSELATESGLQVLQGGLNLEFRGGLPSSGPPSQRLLNTLFVLNSTGELTGGEVPFENYLANAVALSGPRMESVELEKFLKKLRS